jgi:phospholipid/cholesterol/gamma-HCH transport system substrate-binding protein
MMLTPLIRRQLRVLTVLTVVSVGMTALLYARVPSLLGIGVYDVSADFRDASGLYPRAIVTYRGVQVGDVSKLELTEDGARATLRVKSSHDIPDDVVAELHSTSAIGEQYIELVPGDSKDFLEHGDVIPTGRTKELPQISPVLDKLNGLLESVPRQQTRRVLAELDRGLGGSGDDIAGVVDNASELVTAAQVELDSTTSLITALRPMLDTQIEQLGHTRAYARSLAQFTTEVAGHDADVRALLDDAPAGLSSATAFVKDSRATLPTLLANLTTNAEVFNTYLPNLEQILVVYPATVGRLQQAVNPRAAEGDVKLDLRANLDDPEHCTAGYLPVGQRRSPGEGSVRPVDGSAHCTLARGAGPTVRGARNLPCPNGSGRAALPRGCGLDFGDGRQTPVRARPGETLAPDGRAYRFEQYLPLEGDEGWKTFVLRQLGLG